MRKLSALIVAAALVASLAACSSQTTSANCAPKPAAGEAASLVTATGDFGTQTTAKFPTPLIATDLQVAQITPGTGKTLVEGDYADARATIWNAQTGDFLVATSFDAADHPIFEVNPTGDSISPMFQCATVGGRFAAVMTVKQALGNQDLSSVGMTPDSDVVVIADITTGFAGKANGTDQPAKPGLPGVVTAPDGTPGITMTTTQAPTALTSSVIKQGDGATVKAGDIVTFNYTGYVWATPATVFASSWPAKKPITTQAIPYVADTGAGLFPGTDASIIGQKVGSQVLVIVPPDKATGSADGVAEGSTRIYVIDILNTQAS